MFASSSCHPHRSKQKRRTIGIALCNETAEKKCSITVCIHSRIIISLRLELRQQKVGNIKAHNMKIERVHNKWFELFRWMDEEKCIKNILIISICKIASYEALTSYTERDPASALWRAAGKIRDPCKAKRQINRLKYLQIVLEFWFFSFSSLQFQIDILRNRHLKKWHRIVAFSAVAKWNLSLSLDRDVFGCFHALLSEVPRTPFAFLSSTSRAMRLAKKA